MIVELFGLPAAGKTTIAKILERESALSSVKIKNVWELLFFNILFCHKYPVVAAKIFSHTLNYRDFVNFFLYRNAKYEKAARYKKALVDEGLFQNLLSIFKKPVDEKAFLKFAQGLPKPDLLVIVELNKEERGRRNVIRGTPARMDREYFYEEFLKILPQLNLKYFKINADNSGAAASIIKNYVESN